MNAFQEQVIALLTEILAELKKPKTTKVTQKVNEDLQKKFEELYSLYPRKAGKKAGMQKLAKLVKTEKDFLRVKKAIETYANHCYQNQTQEQYIKHFGTFINNIEDWIGIEATLGSSTEFKQRDLQF